MNFAQVDFPHPPRRRPVIGDFGTMMRRHRGRPVQRAVEVLADFTEPVVEVKLFNAKLVLVRSGLVGAELCDETRFEKRLAPGLITLRQLAGDGLFTAFNDEPNWQLAHDLLRPAFTRPAMQTYHGTMLQVCRELTDTWDTIEGPVDVSPWLTKMTLETIGRTSFSTDFGSFTSEQVHPFMTSMVDALAAAQRRGFLTSAPLAKLFLRRNQATLDRNREYLDTVLDEIIAARVASGDRSEKDLLGLMLNAEHEASGEKLDLRNVRHQILTFLIAGHETTSGALSFALYYLATNPQVRARAQAETDDILGSDPDAEPTFEQIAKFRYIRRVLDEALRLWPTAPGFVRGAREDTMLAGQWPMTTTDQCMVLAAAIHRDPEIWPEPSRFDPERFTPAAVKARPAHTYFPFGTGERACIGRQFALHEAVLVLARLLHRYEFSADPRYRLKVSERLTLMPEDFRLALTRRTPSGGSQPAADGEPDQAAQPSMMAKRMVSGIASNSVTAARGNSATSVTP